jgi:hypothetical protein
MKTSARVVAGFAIFLADVFFRVPHWRHPAWAHALLIFAALALAPLLLDLAEDEGDAPALRRLRTTLATMQFPTALLLGFACALTPGRWAALAATPWASVLVSLAILGLGRIVRRGQRSWWKTCRDVGLMYSAVGALWLLADRLGLHPLGFSDEIVLLTAVHFHYAGWLLPTIAALALQDAKSSALPPLITGAVILGVPAVAVGITVTQLGQGRAFEAAAALWLALAGFSVGTVQARLAFARRGPAVTQLLLLVAAFSLMGGMIFAALYGVRSFIHPWPWLDIAWMRALHGSLNALGFGFCGTLGWWLERRARPKIPPRAAGFSS